MQLRFFKNWFFQRDRTDEQKLQNQKFSFFHLILERIQVENIFFYFQVTYNLRWLYDIIYNK